MSKADCAAANIASGRMNCAQAVLTAFSEDQDLDPALAFKIAIGFGGGMARTGPDLRRSNRRLYGHWFKIPLPARQAPGK